jgi:O-antigen/teichoic acid export membrane protein
MSASLKSKVIFSAAWTMAGFGTMQVLRFVGNLILTRLLFPEAFGLMAIVQSIMMGIGLLTDVGISTAIIQHVNGGEKRFRDSAWTIQIIRGFGLSVIVAIAAYPLSLVYGQPMLLGILVLAGLGSFISGFNSTNLYLADRNLEAKKVTKLEVVVAVVSLVVTIGLAWMQVGVWSLILGNLASALVKLIGSHLYIKGERNRILIDAESFKQMFDIAKWTFFSSMLLFINNEGARLLIGWLMGIKELGYYAIAISLNLIVWQAAQTISSKTLFPAFAEIYRSNPSRLRSNFQKSRLLLLTPCWIACAIMTIWGPDIVKLLYDSRYADCGRMLQILAAANMFALLWMTYSGVLMSVGMLKKQTEFQLFQMIMQLATICICYAVFGAPGVIYGVAIAAILTYLPSWWVHRSLNIHNLTLDAVFVAMSVSVLFFVFHRNSDGLG